MQRGDVHDDGLSWKSRFGGLSPGRFCRTSNFPPGSETVLSFEESTVII